MRFDLLDEYSTLVPFGLGVSRKRPSQYLAVPAEVAKRGTIANFASHLELLRKLLGALRRMMLTPGHRAIRSAASRTSDESLPAATGWPETSSPPSAASSLRSWWIL